MSRPRKFIEGPVIRNPALVASIALDSGYVMMNGAPKHPSFLISMPLHAIANMARSGRIAFAIPNPDHPENKEKQDA